MKPIALRTMLIICIAVTILMGFIILLSPVLPTRVGVLSFQVQGGDGIHHHYLDFDTGLQIDSLLAHPQYENPQTTVFVSERDNALLVGFTDEDGLDHIVTELEPTPAYQTAMWEVPNESILLIHTDSRNRQTQLARVDVATGQFSRIVTINDLHTGRYILSPDRQYILLREFDDATYGVSTNEFQMWLVNLQSGETTDLGTPFYAHWSPDSSYLVIGHLTDERFQVSVEIYDVVLETINPLQATVSLQDAPYFVGAPEFRTNNGILWSPDSHNLMIHNRHTWELHHISVDGLVHTYADVRLVPRAWSPDGRYVIGIGIHNEQASAVIVDTIDQSLTPLDTDMYIQNDLAEVAWSLNSDYIAVITRTAGLNQQQSLEIFATNGQAITETHRWQSASSRLYLASSLRWLD